MKNERLLMKKCSKIKNTLPIMHIHAIMAVKVAVFIIDNN